MRRRLILVIVGTVVVITLVAGAGTWILTRQSARSGAITEVLSSAQAFGKHDGGTLPIPPITARTGGKQVAQAARATRVVGALIRLATRIDNATLLRVTDGTVPASAIGRTVVPPAVIESTASTGSIGASTARAGSSGSQAWAVEAVAIRFVFEGPKRTRTVTVHYVLALTRSIGSTSFSGDFLLLAGAVIAFAIVVSLALSRRITRPLRRAVEATQRIAEGDLDARVGVHPGDVPELSSLANSIDGMAESLGRLRNAERQFLLSVSHELRTPLTSIRGYSEAILDGTATDPTQAAGVIGNESRRLERLVGDLLDLAKLDARTFSFNLRTVNAAEVVEEVAE
ncbi:MAG: histidine kinase dimerization/phospho-acceptor domain-containing protein, partial [Acidimicrobiales bacterium]